MTSPTTLPAAAMSAEPPPEPFGMVSQIPGGLRLALGIAAVSGWVLLALAWSLSPDPRGFGTHEQLGLAPCGVMTMLGVKCPSCGMTTSWNRLAHGDLGGALAVNVGGALLGLGWFLASPWMAISAWRGKWWGFAPHEWQVLAAGLILLGVTLVDWLIRIMLA